MSDSSFQIDLGEVEAAAKAIQATLDDLEAPTARLEAVIEQIKTTVYGSDAVGKSLTGETSSVGGLPDHQDQVFAGIRAYLQNSAQMAANLELMVQRYRETDANQTADLALLNGGRAAGDPSSELLSAADSGIVEPSYAPPSAAYSGIEQPLRGPLSAADSGIVEPSYAPPSAAYSGIEQPLRGPLSAADSGIVEPSYAPPSAAYSGIEQPLRGPLSAADSGIVEPSYAPPSAAYSGIEQPLRGPLQHSTAPEFKAPEAPDLSYDKHADLDVERGPASSVQHNQRTYE